MTNIVNNILAIGAVIGGVVGISAYLPQVLHLIKNKNSTGLSIIAWYTWLLGSVLLLAYAISIRNIPYTIVDGLYCISNLTMIILIIKYKK